MHSTTPKTSDGSHIEDTLMDFNEDAGLENDGSTLDLTEEEMASLFKQFRSFVGKQGKLNKLEGDIDKLFKAVREVQQKGAPGAGAPQERTMTVGERVVADDLAGQIREGRTAKAKATYEKTSLLAQKRALTSSTASLSEKTYDPDIAYADEQRPPSIASLFRRMPTASPSITYFERTRVAHLITSIPSAVASASTSATLASTAGIVVGSVLTFSPGLGAEEEVTVTVIDHDSKLINFAALSNSHAAGAEVTSTTFAFTPECELKVEADLKYEEKDVTAKTLAVFLILAKQVLDDSPRLQAEIDAELPDMLERALEDQILYGNGTAREFAGVLTNANILTSVWSNAAVGTTKMDLIRLAIAQCAEINRMPEWVLTHPTDLAEMELEKGSDGQYIAKMVLTMDNGQIRLWRLPVHESNSIKKGTALVGSPRGATIYDRESVDVQMSEHDGDNFVKNKVTIRAEQRLAFAVKEPQAFVKVTFDAAPSA